MSDMHKPNIIQSGAEAIIIHEGKFIIKDRIKKGYRHPELDKKIIKQRTKKEAKLLEKASKLIPVPKPFFIPDFNEIKMPFIPGKKLSEHLEQLDWKSICKIIGNQIAKIHDADIIHGDLTTSNMIYVESAPSSKSNLQEAPMKKTRTPKNSDTIINNSKNSRSQRAGAAHEEATSSELSQLGSLEASSNEETAGEIIFTYPRLYFIDFGLGFVSSRIEDKAVDLHLIKQALEAKHFSIHKEAEKIILENYNSKDKTRVLEQLKKVESRGRYRKNAS